MLKHILQPFRTISFRNLQIQDPLVRTGNLKNVRIRLTSVRPDVCAYLLVWPF